MRRRNCSRWFRRLLTALVLMLATRGLGQPTVGLLHATPEAWPGYTLFAPMSSPHTYLIDNEGQLRHRWTSSYLPGAAAYLLPNGHLLRAANNRSPNLRGGGAGGRIEEYDWDGNLVWAFDYSDANHRQHHDAIQLPNGNLLMIAWQRKTSAEAIAAGRNPNSIADGEIWSESLIEVEPRGSTGGNIVWEWHAWDHLVQDLDPTKANFGVVSDHPERIDINYFHAPWAGWLHFNGLDYNPGNDQIVVSVHALNEIWVIDHSTTTAEAASHQGGRQGQGGDLLYRWGNPAAYRRGTEADQTLFGQHNPQWIDDGLPGAGRILVFNNGTGRPEGDFSSVDEIAPPVTGGSYLLGADGTYGPTAATWSYRSDSPETFHAAFISGAQRLPNGNTLICDGPSGDIFEVTDHDDEVWRYRNPVGITGPVENGSEPLRNLLFRATRYPLDDAALAGRDLAPLGTVEIPFDQPLRLVGIQRDESLTWVSWTSVPDQHYEVQYASDPDSAHWEAIAIVQAVGTISFYRDISSDRITRTQGFYRVQENLPWKLFGPNRPETSREEGE